jgi:trans-2,3-dihydro-3-hydroxyanthranilic acid synthase
MSGIPSIQPYPMPTESELPVNTARWTPDPGRAVLLIHDMQGYFVRAFPAGDMPHDDLVTNTALLRDRCAELNMPIAYTAQPGRMNEQQRGLLRDMWGPGMHTTVADRQIVPALAPAEHDWRFTKWRYSAFFGSDLLARMREHGRDQLVLCGVYAHVGLLATAIDAFSNDIETFLVADAVADFTARYHRLALEYAAARCAVVATTGQVLRQLRAATTHMTSTGGGVG